MTEANAHRGEQWAGRPRAARLIKIVAWITPIAVSVVATHYISRAVPRPLGLVPTILWFVALTLVATSVLYLTDKAARRLLPLAALLQLSLVFPDRAPSRYRSALRTQTVHQLEQRVAAIKADGLPDDATEAAETLIELVAALSAHDRLTRGHAERVRAYSRMIGEEMDLKEDELELLQWAGLLHDVGKLFVPGEILNKPGRLTDEEFEVIKQHPGWGAQLCEPLRGWLGDWVDAVGEHHERWDGKGYPNGLAGEEISLAARIVAVADVFDVITSVRSYKQAGGATAAREELARCAGTQFDERVVRAFLNLGLGKLRIAMGPLSWFAQLPAIGSTPIAPAIGGVASVAATAGTLMAGGLLDEVPQSFEPVVDAATPAATTTSTTLAPLPPPTTLVVEVTTPPPTAAPTTTSPPTTTTTPPATTTTTTTVVPTTTTTVAPTTTIAVPRPPVLDPIGDRTVVEGSTLVFTVTARHPDGTSPLTFSATGMPAGATLDATSGEFVWTPAETQGATSHLVTFTVTDADGRSVSETVAIFVDDVNGAPVLAPVGDRTVDENTTLAFTLVATDPDVPADALTFSVSGLPSGATLDTVTGDFTWTPDETQGGATFPITFRVSDDGVGALDDIETITITVAEVNTAPVLAPVGDRTTDEGTPLAFGLTASDPDAPADTLTFSATGLPAGATLDAATGAFAWTPTEAQGGATFPITFRVSDDGVGALDDSETITITVAEVNTAPVLAPVGDRTVAETTLLAFTLNAVDVDAPADVLTFSAIGLPVGATLDAATGDVAWTPTEAQGGTSFPVTFTVTDDGTGALSDSESVVFTVAEVNTAPVLAPIGDRTADEWENVAFVLAATDSDLPPDSLTFSATGLPAGATLDPTSGSFAWVPTESQDGAHTITFAVTDDGSAPLADSENVTITVVEVNTAPELAPVGDRTVDEFEPITFTLTATDVDVPAATLTYSATGLPGGASLDPVTGDFSWTPNEGHGGIDHVITFSVTDDGTPPLTDSETVTITVDEVNSAPTLVPIGDRTVDEGTALTFTVGAVDPDVPADALTFSATGLPAGATLDPTTGDVAWTPTEAQGPASYLVTFTVTDDGTPSLADSETIAIFVNETNQAPVLDPVGDRSVAEMTLLAFTLTGSDPDVPANGLTFSATGLPTGATLDPATGDVTWTPSETDDGPHVVTFRVTDDGTGTPSDSETITITVTEANRAPVLDPVGDRTVDEQATLTFTATASDPDVPANGLTYSATGLPAGATLDPATGDFAWTPDETQGGATYPVTITVTDDGTGALADSETITITVAEVNSVPTLLPIGDRTVDEQTPLTFTIAGTDPDDPADTLTYSAAGLPAGATLDPVTGDFAWTPSEAQGAASYLVTFVVTDDGAGALSDSEDVALLVSEVNVAPVLDPVGDRTSDEQTLLEFTLTASDADLPANGLTFSATGLPAGATLDPSTGEFKWTPTEAQDGASSITFTVTDDGSPALTDSETITITIDEVNVAPVLDPIGDRAVDEQTSLLFTVTATDADLPANGLTFTATGLPAGATLDPSTGAFSWSPSESQGGGTYPVTFTVTDDGTGTLSDSETITITVNEVNQAPVIADPGDQFSVVGEVISLFVVASDPDDPPNSFVYTAVGLPTGLSIDPNTGEISGTVTTASTTTATVTVTEVDGAPTNMTASRTWSWTVSPVSTVVISELATVGPGGDTDEFIELFNTTGSPVNISGWEVRLSDGDGLALTTITIPNGTNLAANEYYLLAHADAAGAIGADLSYPIDIPLGGGVALFTKAGVEADAVGTGPSPWKSGSGSLYGEGTHLPPMDGFVSQSYERHSGVGNCIDTGNNAADFFHNMSNRNPQPSGTTAVCGSPPPFVPPPPADHIVISEFRFDGPLGGKDEFIELYNPTSSPIDVTGYILRDQDLKGIALLAGTIGPGRHLLVADLDFFLSTGIVPDVWSLDSVKNDAGVYLRDSGGALVDAVSTGGTAQMEGPPLPPINGRVTHSYERRIGGAGGNCVDTDVNVDDFFHNLASENPQTLADPPVPCGT